MPRIFSAHRLGLALLTLSVLSLSSSQATAQKLLRWKLQPGETIEVRLAQVMNTEAAIQDAVLKSTVEMLMSMKWEVIGIDAQGTAEMTQSIERMKMNMVTPGMDKLTYDSESKEAPAGPARSIAAGIEPLLGVKFIQKMNNRGEIVDVRLSPEAAEALDRVPSGAQLKEMFSEDGLKSLVSQAAAVLPEAPVRPGDTWQGLSETKSSAGDLKMDMKYTYYGTEPRRGRPLEKIGVQLRLSFPEETNPLGLRVRVTDQDNSGLLFFDANSGQFVETQLHQTMTLQTALGDQTHQQKLDMRLHMQFVSDRTAGRPTTARRTARTPSRAAPRQPARSRR